MAKLKHRFKLKKLLKREGFKHGQLSKVNLTIFALIFAGVGVFILLHSFAATTYYVSPSGADTNSGSQSAPFATITKALSISNGGETIHVAAGTYPKVDNRKKYTSMVTVVGDGPRGSSVINGESDTSGYHYAIVLFGVNNLTFSNFKLVGRDMIADDVFHKAGDSHITLENNEITSFEGGNCVTIRNNANYVTVRNNYIHDCATGIGGPNYNNGDPTYNAHDITIQDNTLRNFTGDAIQFADWDNVVFDHNDIQYVRDPNGVIHNDGIQFTGNSHHVKITNNILAHSSQLIFVQSAFGPISDVLIQNNLVYDARAYAVQIQGIEDTRFINNIVWDSGFGGLLIRKDGYNNIVTTDTVVANNILYGFSKAEGADTAYEDYNIIRNTAIKPDNLGPHDKVGVDPGFIKPTDSGTHLLPGQSDLDDSNYHLLSTSPAIDAGTSDHEALATDLEGRPRVDIPAVINSGAGPVSYYDIGSYEYQTGGVVPPPPAIKIGDLNQDNQVNIFDVSIMLSKYGTNDTSADLNGDHIVDIFDLSLLLSNYVTLK